MFCSSLVIHLSNRESLEKPPSYKICFQTSRSLYPLSINHFSRSLHLLLKDLGSEQILFSRRTCLYGILFLQWCGWHEEDWRYWWLPLGLTYKSVVTFPPRTETLTSKKLVEAWDHSDVTSYRCSQRKKDVIYESPSQVWLHFYFTKNFLFNLDHKKIYYTVEQIMYQELHHLVALKFFP